MTINQGGRTWTIGGVTFTTEMETKARFRNYFDPDQPRDRKGRWIETGATVSIWGGGTGTVARNIGGGRLEIHTGDGRKLAIHRNYLTVTQSARGAKPSGRPGDRPRPIRAAKPSRDVEEFTPASSDTRVPVSELKPGQLALVYGWDQFGADTYNIGRISSVAVAGPPQDADTKPGTGYSVTFEREASHFWTMYTSDDAVARVVPEAEFAPLVEAEQRGDEEAATRIALDIYGRILTGDESEAQAEPGTPAPERQEPAELRAGQWITSPAFGDPVRVEQIQDTLTGAEVDITTIRGDRRTLAEEELGAWQPTDEPANHRADGAPVAPQARPQEGLFADMGTDKDGNRDLFMALDEDDAPAAAPAVQETEQPADGRTGEERILAAYAEAAAGPASWVSLARLRPLLGDMPRAEQDEALTALERRPDVNLAPESNQKTLTEEDRAAALHIGAQDRHLLWVGTERPAAGQWITAPGADDPVRVERVRDSYDGPLADVVTAGGERATLEGWSLWGWKPADEPAADDATDELDGEQEQRAAAVQPAAPAAPESKPADEGRVVRGSRWGHAWEVDGVRSRVNFNSPEEAREALNRYREYRANPPEREHARLDRSANGEGPLERGDFIDLPRWDVYGGRVEDIRDGGITNPSAPNPTAMTEIEVRRPDGVRVRARVVEAHTVARFKPEDARAHRDELLAPIRAQERADAAANLAAMAEEAAARQERRAWDGTGEITEGNLGFAAEQIGMSDEALAAAVAGNAKVPGRVRTQANAFHERTTAHGDDFFNDGMMAAHAAADAAPLYPEGATGPSLATILAGLGRGIQERGISVDAEWLAGRDLARRLLDGDEEALGGSGARRREGAAAYLKQYATAAGRAKGDQGNDVRERVARAQESLAGYTEPDPVPEPDGPLASTDDGNPPSPEGISPGRRAQLVDLIEDQAATYVGTGDPGRYLSEVAGEQGVPRPGERDWIDAYLAAHPEVLTFSQEEREQRGRERAERQAAGRQRAGDLSRQARAAFDEGRFDEALTLLDEAEAADPTGRNWERLRDRIRAGRDDSAVGSGQDPVELSTDPEPAEAPEQPQESGRRQQMSSLVRQARAAYDRGDVDEASRLVDEAEQFAPGDARLGQIRATIAESQRPAQPDGSAGSPLTYRRNGAGFDVLQDGAPIGTVEKRFRSWYWKVIGDDNYVPVSEATRKAAAEKVAWAIQTRAELADFESRRRARDEARIRELEGEGYARTPGVEVQPGDMMRYLSGPAATVGWSQPVLVDQAQPFGSDGGALIRYVRMDGTTDLTIVDKDRREVMRADRTPEADEVWTRHLADTDDSPAALARRAVPDGHEAAEWGDIQPEDVIRVPTRIRNGYVMEWSGPLLVEEIQPRRRGGYDIWHEENGFGIYTRLNPVNEGVAAFGVLRDESAARPGPVSREDLTPAEGVFSPEGESAVRTAVAAFTAELDILPLSGVAGARMDLAGALDRALTGAPDPRRAMAERQRIQQVADQLGRAWNRESRARIAAGYRESALERIPRHLAQAEAARVSGDTDRALRWIAEAEKEHRRWVPDTPAPDWEALRRQAETPPAGDDAAAEEVLEVRAPYLPAAGVFSPGDEESVTAAAQQFDAALAAGGDPDAVNSALSQLSVTVWMAANNLPEGAERQRGEAERDRIVQEARVAAGLDSEPERADPDGLPALESEVVEPGQLRPGDVVEFPDNPYNGPVAPLPVDYIRRVRGGIELWGLPGTSFAAGDANGDPNGRRMVRIGMTDQVRRRVTMERHAEIGERARAERATAVVGSQLRPGDEVSIDTRGGADMVLGGENPPQVGEWMVLRGRVGDVRSTSIDMAEVTAWQPDSLAWVTRDGRSGPVTGRTNVFIDNDTVVYRHDTPAPAGQEAAAEGRPPAPDGQAYAGDIRVGDTIEEAVWRAAPVSAGDLRDGTSAYASPGGPARLGEPERASRRVAAIEPAMGGEGVTLVFDDGTRVRRHNADLVTLGTPAEVAEDGQRVGEWVPHAAAETGDRIRFTAAGPTLPRGMDLEGLGIGRFDQVSVEGRIVRRQPGLPSAVLEQLAVVRADGSRVEVPGQHRFSLRSRVIRLDDSEPEPAPEQVSGGGLIEGDRITGPDGVDVAVERVEPLDDGVVSALVRADDDARARHVIGVEQPVRLAPARTEATVSEIEAGSVAPGDWVLVDDDTMQVASLPDVSGGRARFDVRDEQGRLSEMEMDERLLLARVDGTPTPVLTAAAEAVEEVAAAVEAPLAEVEPLPDGTPTGRVRLRTEQRRRILDLRLDTAGGAGPEVAQAAARLRARQEMSADQMRALAGHLRGLLDDDTLPAVRRRSLGRTAAWIDAAQARLEGFPPPPHQPGRATPERAYARNLGMGDVIAVPDGDGMVRFATVTVSRSVKGFGLHAVHLRHEDGTVEQRVLPDGVDLWLMPDLPADEPVQPPQFTREHVTADRVGVGDIIRWDGDQFTDPVVGDVLAVERRGGEFAEVRRYEMRVRDGDDRERTVTVADRGWPSVERLERGPSTAGQPYDSIMQAENPEYIGWRDLRVGDRATVSMVTGTITGITRHPASDEVPEGATVAMLSDSGEQRTASVFDDPDQPEDYIDPSVMRLIPADDNAAARIAETRRSRERVTRERQFTAFLADLETSRSRWAATDVAEALRGQPADADRDTALAAALAQLDRIDAMDDTAAATLAFRLGARDDTQVAAMADATRAVTAAVKTRATGRIRAALGEVDLLAGESWPRALARVAASYRDHPPAPGVLPAGASLARLRDRITAAPEQQVPALPGMPEDGDLRGRMAGYRALLPDDLADLGRHPVTRTVFEPVGIDDLEAGRLPAVRQVVLWAPDVADDDGPGPEAMRQLAVLRAAGTDMDARFRQHLAGRDAALGAELDAVVRERGQAWKTADDLDAELERVRRAGGEPDTGLVEQRDDATARWQAAAAREQELRRMQAEARREALAATLAEVRQLGGEGLDYTDRAGRPLSGRAGSNAAALRYVEEVLPADWLARSREAGPVEVVTGPGQHRRVRADGTTRISLPGDDNTAVVPAIREGQPGRVEVPSAQPGGVAKATVAAHELGHHLEATVPGLREAGHALLWDRSSYGPVGDRTRMEPMVGEDRGRPFEIFPGDFPDARTGRVNADGSQEVFANVLESLAGSGDFADDDLRHWGLGVLALLGTDTAGPMGGSDRGEVEARDPLDGINLLALSDDQLRALVGRIGDPQALARLRGELERRERAQQDDELDLAELSDAELESMALSGWDGYGEDPARTARQDRVLAEIEEREAERGRRGDELGDLAASDLLGMDTDDLAALFARNLGRYDTDPAVTALLDQISAELDDRDRREQAGPDPYAGLDLAGMSDEQLGELAERHQPLYYSDPWSAALVRRIFDEVDGRDRDRQQEDARTPEEVRIDELIAQGWQPRDAYAEVHGLDAEEMDRQERIALIDAERGAGERREQVVRRMYRQWVHEQWLAAEKATNGYLLSSFGRKAGVNPERLWGGNPVHAFAYASEELKRWWADQPNGGRMTYDEWRAQWLGDSRDRRQAQERRQTSGNGRDFG